MGMMVTDRWPGTTAGGQGRAPKAALPLVFHCHLQRQRNISMPVFITFKHLRA